MFYNGTVPIINFPMCLVKLTSSDTWLSVIINSLWPSSTICCQIYVCTLVQVMAWCLTAPSHVDLLSMNSSGIDFWVMFTGTLKVFIQSYVWNLYFWNHNHIIRWDTELISVICLKSVICLRFNFIRLALHRGTKSFINIWVTDSIPRAIHKFCLFWVLSNNLTHILLTHWGRNKIAAIFRTNVFKCIFLNEDFDIP